MLIIRNLAKKKKNECDIFIFYFKQYFRLPQEDYSFVNFTFIVKYV